MSVATSGSTGHTPPPDADPVDGDCPYLSKADVESALGQRMGKTKIRAATPQPVCDFVRSDGSYLAQARVLQFTTEAQARAAVDYYAPRDTSNPETKAAGWTGGSLRTDAGSIVAVSKAGYAVVVESDRIQTVDTRQLVLAAITNLGL